ncbi:MAG TPA: antibiotic biosynthesis monooxygenase [Paenibacillaceae bacterium]|nr:antibiotic biosynthesis monooxygenase [Paenibacillaceae bacterium]
MFTVHVSFQVKADSISAFKEASLENAQNSIKEKGITRFDVMQNQEDPLKFLFVETYLSTEDQQKHRETEHYQKWRSIILDLLKEPYTFEKFNPIFLAD